MDPCTTRTPLRIQQHNPPAGEQKISVIFYIGVRFKSICGIFELRRSNTAK